LRGRHLEKLKRSRGTLQKPLGTQKVKGSKNEGNSCQKNPKILSSGQFSRGPRRGLIRKEGREALGIRNSFFLRVSDCRIRGDPKGKKGEVSSDGQMLR